jgi:hypothetical protein
VDNYAHLSGISTVAFRLKKGLDVVLHRFYSHGFAKSVGNVRVRFYLDGLRLLFFQIAIYNASNDFYKVDFFMSCFRE